MGVGLKEVGRVLVEVNWIGNLEMKSGLVQSCRQRPVPNLV